MEESCAYYQSSTPVDILRIDSKELLRVRGDKLDSLQMSHHSNPTHEVFTAQPTRMTGSSDQLSVALVDRS